MSDSQSIEPTIIIPQQSEALIPLDEFKSFFYQLNAKPDTELRLLPSGKVLELSDIRSINERVGAKLKNYDVVAEITSINFVLSNRKLKDFSTWAEFERENWDTINEKIESIGITWDISLKLPQFKLPQRHSMKLRIGDAIAPKDMFQLVLTSDDISELLEAGSPGICKVDFVNSIIAIELLNIASSWHEGLKNTPEAVFFQKFLRKQGKSLSEIIRYSLPILLLVVTHQYSEYLFPALGIGHEVSLNSIEKVLIFLSAIFMTGFYIGLKVERSIDRKINKFEEYPSFLITRGDRKKVEEFESNNEKLTKQIGGKILWILFSISASAGIKFLVGQIKFS
jgi:hypothetical protein